MAHHNHGKEIRGSVKYANSIGEIWSDLQERFGKESAPHEFELKQSMCNTRQDGMTVSTYYMKGEGFGEGGGDIRSGAEEHQGGKIEDGSDEEMDEKMELDILVRPFPTTNLNRCRWSRGLHVRFLFTLSEVKVAGVGLWERKGLGSRWVLFRFH
ncbi:hypothetical protein OSB04_021009 [Centaurea solstitialis]|uniref:Uncharacterized protein n=1 Tax=Centaurea solstitialis TaxID=347529 RepID=A0AA38WHE4_9ASTR|nr:hypothetical protein OSB04_021009 [Centaurea solstitialis]